MAEPTIAEILAEWRRLKEAHAKTVNVVNGNDWREAERLCDEFDRFRLEHFSRLAAVAEAAVEREAAQEAAAKEGDGGGPAAWRLFRADEALRRSLRPEEGGSNG